MKIMPETWSKIEGFPNYSVSTEGRVINDNTGEIKQTKLCKGYNAVDLYSNGKRTTKRVHRLVCETFLDNPDNKEQVNHKNGIKTDNRLDNLEWVTASENVQHAFANGLSKPSRNMLGKKNPNAGRHGKKVLIIETGEVYESTLECEKAINGNASHISDCALGRQNTHRGYHFKYI